MKIVALLVEALKDPVGKLVELVNKVITDFKSFITDLIADLMEAILKPIIESIAGVVEGIDELIGLLVGLIKDIFAGIKIDLTKLKLHPAWPKVAGFVAMLICFFKFLFGFIVAFPGLFF